MPTVYREALQQAFAQMSFRINLAVLKARSMPADVSGIIKCDSWILYRFG